jgi:hypothetical protein
MKKIILYEAPIDDFLDQKSKESILKAQNRKYQSAKESGGNYNNMATLMQYLPIAENQHKDKLLKLAKAIFFSRFPKIKERVDQGLVKLDAQFSTTPGGRKTKQTISTDEIQKAKENDSLFDERIKARNFINATTQGSGWADGFNAYKEIESQLNQLDPDLVKKYKQFEDSATVFYNENVEAIENMAKQSMGRVAYLDIIKDPEKPGSWIIEVRAPHFPLLMHELQKAGRYFNSILYLPKDKNLGQTLTQITDTHKHEIRNMITGREISSKLKFLWSELIDDYEPWMDNAIQTQFNKMANDNPNLFNEIMYDGVLSGKPTAMDKFEKYSQMIVDTIKKNPPKMEKVDYNKLIQSEKEPQSYEDEDEYDDDDFNPDDWDDFNIDDEDED